MTKLPTKNQPINMDPALEDAVGELLEPYEGEELEVAQEAVRKAHGSGFRGGFHELVDHYRTHIEEAVAEVD